MPGRLGALAMDTDVAVFHAPVNEGNTRRAYYQQAATRVLISGMVISRLAAAAMLLAAGLTSAQTIRVPVRSQGKATERALALPSTAIIVCDMWDKHWCSGATRRVGALVESMEPFLRQARAAGIQIVFAPSETMDFYREYPQRQAMLALKKIEPPAALDLPDPPLPIDDKSGGCDTHDTFYKAWTRQHPGLTIDPRDRISDNGREVYSFLKERRIENLLVMGVHANMCVLNRSFAIKQMTRWGMRCLLVRDMTDSMYDPQDRPFVAHDEGTRLVIDHIEKYWAPSLTSKDFLAALK